MDIRILTSPEDLSRYGEWIKTHSHATLWQSLEWKRYQEAMGRDVRIYGALVEGKISASALVVIDRTAFGLSTWEIPRGPLVSKELRIMNYENLLQTIVEDAKRDRCISLFWSPSEPILHSSFIIHNSRRFVMPQATRVVDLTQPEDAILGQMKPKGRYNIGVAERHGVTVEISADVDAFTDLAHMTAARDGFSLPSSMTYLRFLETLPGSFLLLARTKDARKPVAGLLGVIWGNTGTYYYGASDNEHRELMAPYMLQWEAMKHCKAKGCRVYDLFGTAPENQPDHPWKGVSEFKAKFGGSVINYPPEQEIVLRPMVKRLLAVKRRIFK